MNTPTQLPNTVAVGPVDYSVREDAAALDRSRGTTGDHRWGESDRKLLEIILDPLLPASRMREVLLHECIHSLLYEWHINIKNLDDEEPLVESLGDAFLALIRDNPQLIAYVSQK